MQTRLMVVGVGPDSLGEDVAAQARVHPYFKDGVIDTYDLFGFADTRSDLQEEPRFMDVKQPNTILRALRMSRPTHVVCTVGVNSYVDDAEKHDDPERNFRSLHRSLAEVMAVNATGVVMLASAFRDMISHESNETMGLRGEEGDYFAKYRGFHFAAISSNSAHIARTGSTPYCMSKAALSMGMRCIARESARIRLPIAFTTYEPGFLSGTPMSLNIVGSTDEFQEARYHRIPSGMSMQPTDLSEVILNNMKVNWNLMNGACIRLDGGEQ